VDGVARWSERVEEGRDGGSIQSDIMIIERVKYILWAADTDRAIAFYETVCGARVVRRNPAIAELEINGAVIGIHGGGSGERTWTGLAFQVADVVAGAREVVAAGGLVPREPEPEDGEPPHLAMCVDTEGNEFMLSRKRH
jgi:predicted enzyme related to lactoylglutathione lyase